MLRLAREAKALAKKRKLQAIAAAKKKIADAIKAVKRAKAEKMRMILAKAMAAANAAKAKKLRLRNKTVKQVHDACYSAMRKVAKSSFAKHYQSNFAKSKSDDKATKKAGLECIDDIKVMKKSLYKQMAKKVGAHDAKKIIDSVYQKIKSLLSKKVRMARKDHKMKKKATSVKAAVKAALKGKKVHAAKVLKKIAKKAAKKSKKSKKLLLVQERA